jgi:hypothetical protein
MRAEGVRVLAFFGEEQIWFLTRSMASAAAGFTSRGDRPRMNFLSAVPSCRLDCVSNAMWKARRQPEDHSTNTTLLGNAVKLGDAAIGDGRYVGESETPGT